MEQAFVVKWSNGLSEMKVLCKESGLRQLAKTLGGSQLLQVSLAGWDKLSEEPTQRRSEPTTEKISSPTSGDATSGSSSTAQSYPSVDAIFETPAMHEEPASGATRSSDGRMTPADWLTRHEQQERSTRRRNIARSVLLTMLFVITPLSALLALG